MAALRRLRGAKDAAAGAAACLALFAAASGCADPGGAENEAAIVRDSAGVEIVSNAEPDRPLPWTIEPVLRIGDVLGPPETSFADLTDHSVAAGPEGTLVVLNRGAKQVVVFAPDGEVIRAFGRAGRGPDEMWNPVSVWAAPDGRIRVHDWADGVLTYEFDGSLVADERGIVGGGGFGMQIEELPGGFVYTVSLGFRSDTLLVEQLLFAARDTVVLAEWRKRPAKMVEYPSCRLRLQWSPIFEPELVWDAGAAGVAVVGGYGYRIDVYDLTGGLARSVRRAGEPVRVDREIALRQAATISGVKVSDRVCEFDPEELVDDRGFYDFIQPIETVSISPTGDLWARRLRPGKDPGPIDVFDANGRYVGTLPAETPFPRAWLQDDRFATIETDELEVQFVMIYEVVQ